MSEVKNINLSIMNCNGFNIYKSKYNWDDSLRNDLIKKYENEPQSESITQIITILKDGYALRPFWWACEAILLEKTQNLLKKNNLYENKFAACSGTMLSLVRFYNYMPWDDDMDYMLFVDKSTYNTNISNFLKSFLEENKGKYKIQLRCYFTREQSLIYDPSQTKSDKRIANLMISLTEPTNLPNKILNYRDASTEYYGFFQLITEKEYYKSSLNKFGIDYSQDIGYGNRPGNLSKKPWLDIFLCFKQDNGNYKTYKGEFEYKEVHPIKKVPFINRFFETQLVHNTKYQFTKEYPTDTSDYINDLVIYPPHGRSDLKEKNGVMTFKNTQEWKEFTEVYNNHIKDVINLIKINIEGNANDQLIHLNGGSNVNSLINLIYNL